MVQLQSEPIAFSEIERKHPGLPATITHASERTSKEQANREAIVEGSERLTYAELKVKSDTIARALAAAGLSKGDHIGICVGNGPGWVAIFLGILRLGGVCVPINTRLKAEEIAHQLRQSDVRLLFTVDELLSIDFISLFRKICPDVDRSLPGDAFPALKQIVVIGKSEAVPAACTDFAAFTAEGSQAELPPPPQPNDPALIQYTSGTTSFPKGVLLTHRSIVTDAYFVGLRIGIRPSDRYLSARPFFHVAGSTLSVVVSLVFGATLVTMKRFIAEDALRLLEEERCTLTSGNDTMFLMMLNSERFSHHRYVLRGGWAAASPSILQRIIDDFGATEVVVAYGLSESAPNAAISDSRAPVEDRVAGWMTPHPGLVVRIVDPATEKEVPRGTKGEIRVRGWSVMQEYYNASEATAATFDRNGFLKTGDIGVMRENGDLQFAGRMKEIIRVGGENVAPSEVENLLHQHPKVKQAIVFALPDPRLMETPGAYIVTRDGETLSSEEILAWAKPRLAGFKLPTHVAIFDSFEAVGMTASSKIQRRHLIEHAIRHFGLGDRRPE